MGSVCCTCPRAHGGLPLPLMAIGSVSVQNNKFVGVYVILLAEETRRIDIDRDVRVFTVVTPRVSWGTNISEIFGPPGPDISQGPRNYRGSACT